jgi:hypothetical protein
MRNPQHCLYMLGRGWKSPRGGVNRRNLKFITLNTIYKSRLALEINRVQKRGRKQINQEIKRMTRWFVLPRFSSWKPTPRWGGHKDRVSFNPFPLLNGHLDRVSFLLNQTGHLDPTRTTTTWCLLLWLKVSWEQEWGRRKRSKNKSSKNTSKTLSLSLVTICLEWNWDLERLWFYWIVSCIDCPSSCIEWDIWKTWMLGVVVVGGIYSPNHQFNRWGLSVDGRTGHCPVLQPRHHPVRVLTVSTVGDLTSWGTGQPGAAPDSHYSLSGAPSSAALTLRELSAHCSTFAGVRWSGPLCWSRCSACTPDSSVAHRTVWWIIA